VHYANEYCSPARELRLPSVIMRSNISQCMRVLGIMKVQVRVDRRAVEVRVRVYSLLLAQYKIESPGSEHDNHERNCQLKESRDSFRNLDPEKDHEYAHHQN